MTPLISLCFILLLNFNCIVNAFHGLAVRLADSGSASVAATAAESVSASTWSPDQLVDVTGAHAYQDPRPGQPRGPCPAQNALANHGYLDRSGYTTFVDCVSANVQVYNFGYDFASFLCLVGQFTGGPTLPVAPFSIGNSSDFDSTVQSACPTTGLLGFLNPLLCNLGAFLDNAFGTKSFGMAQTHNSFEGDSSFLQPDWATINGFDASSLDMSVVNEFWSTHLADGTWDDYDIFVNWTSARKAYGIATNPCYFRAPQATNLAALGAYALVPRCLANFTQEKPDGTLTEQVMMSFFGLKKDSNGNLVFKGQGKEQIPDNWYQRPTPYTIPQFLADDYSKFIENDPSLIDIGGNTDGVNTFTGLDVGNLTGGVINGANLLQGDNFVCFYYRLLTIDLQNKLPLAVGAALLGIGNTVGEVIDAVFDRCTTNGVSACPTFTYNDIHNYQQYCGVRQQPGGIY